MKPTASAAECLESGMFYFGKSQYNEAAACFERAIWADPNCHEAWNNRGNTLQTIGNHFDAILNYDRAIALKPDMSGPHSNKGSALAALGRHAEAMACYHRAVEIDPGFAQGWCNIGNAHRDRCELEAAIAALRKAVAANPSYADANLALSFCELETGDFAAGWERFEWRWKSGQIFPRGLSCPQWEGEDLNGKSILLYSEQGHGDGLQFMRFVDVLKERWPDAVIDLEVRLPLARLAGTLRGVNNVVVFGDRLNGYDFASALMSVPRVIGLTVDTIPGHCPYLWPSSDRVLAWQAELDRDLAQFGRRFRIGICWAGMNRPLQAGAAAIDARRSTALAQWAPVAEVPGTIFISLQKDGPVEQLRSPPPGMIIANSADQFEDFADTAALIACCDLVISVDTAVAHLAGAIGKPVWMLSRFDGCWRWMGARPDSPWYPTLRQFRQPASGDWQSVMTVVRDELAKAVSLASSAASTEILIAAE